MIASKLKPRGDNSPLSLPSRTIKARATAEAGSKKQRFYKPLPTRFRRDGFNYQRIARDGDVAIDEQTWSSGGSNPSVCYAVIGIRYREGFQINGRFVEPAEVYPNSDTWGVDGFTFTNKGAAFAKLREVAK